MCIEKYILVNPDNKITVKEESNITTDEMRISLLNKFVNGKFAIAAGSKLETPYVLVFNEESMEEEMEFPLNTIGSYLNGVERNGFILGDICVAKFVNGKVCGLDDEEVASMKKEIKCLISRIPE